MEVDFFGGDDEVLEMDRGDSCITPSVLSASGQY